MNCLFGHPPSSASPGGLIVLVFIDVGRGWAIFIKKEEEYLIPPPPALKRFRTVFCCKMCGL
jgi:hypothetical protein